MPTLATLLKTGRLPDRRVRRRLRARRPLRAESRGFDDYDDRHAARRRRPTFHFAERRASAVVAAAGRLDLHARHWTESRTGPGSPGCTCSIRTRPYDAPAGIPHRPRAVRRGSRLRRRDARPVARPPATPPHALDRTLVVVTADHGESLGEHGETTHGLFAYDATLAVPLVVSGPAIRAGDRRRAGRARRHRADDSRPARSRCRRADRRPVAGAPAAARPADLFRSARRVADARLGAAARHRAGRLEVHRPARRRAVRSARRSRRAAQPRSSAIAHGGAAEARAAARVAPADGGAARRRWMPKRRRGCDRSATRPAASARTRGDRRWPTIRSGWSR